MFLATASTRRPIAMGCLLIALIALGINSFRKLALEDLPAVDIPYVTVLTVWPGASAEDMEKDISKLIEDALSGIDGLKHIESSSLENLSMVALEFQLEVNVDVAAQDVREKLDVVLADLPADAERPVVQKINVNSQPIANLFLSGDAPIDDLYDYADHYLSDRFATVAGVAEVQLIGGNEREVWVELDPTRLASAGLTATGVATAVGQGVLTIPGGRIIERGSEYSVRFNAEYEDISELEDLELVSHDGARVRLSDVGTVRFATEEIRQRAVLDGKLGVVLKIVKKAEGNSVAVVREAKRRFQEVQEFLPGGMELTWVSDDAESIQASIDSTISSVMGAILLCAGILFVFLVNIRTTLIVTITMPITILISLFFLHVTGQSINMVTLLAIGLSTGVLVSNSIVVLESIVSWLDKTDDRWEAAREGASEVGVAVLASAGTNVIVMFPIAMMSSMIGRVFAPFAIATLTVNAISIFISFTLTPILCALLLQPLSERRDNAFARFGQRWNKGFDTVAERFTNGLRIIAARKIYNLPLVIGFVVLLVLTVRMGGNRLGFSLFATDDIGRLFIRAEYPPYYNLENTVERLENLQERLLGLPDLEHVLTTAGKAESHGGQATEGVYMGQIELFFKPKTERAWTIHERLAEVREMIADELDCRIAASVPGKMGGQSFQINYTLSGPDLEILEETATTIRDEAALLPGVAQIDTTVRDSKPELQVVPKRAVLADIGMPPAALGALIRANVDGIEAADYKRGDRTYDIRVKLLEQDGRDQLRQSMLPGADGRPIPLETVADVVESQSIIQIFRVDKQRSIKLLGDIDKDATMSEVGNAIGSMIEEKGLLPVGYSLDLSGTNEIMEETIADFGEAILLAAFLTLLGLAAILESWSRPALVLLTLPMGLIGVIWALVFSGEPLTVLALLGILMLIGVVVNPAILVVDKMAQHLKDGVPRRRAMLTAMREEFRPVLMVFLASGLGMLPIAIGRGIGSENRSGIGIASVGGILVAGILTLLVLPLIYTMTTRKSK